MEFCNQKPNVSYGTKGYIPKAKHRAQKLCMDNITLDSPLDFHEVQDTEIASLNKSKLTSYFFPEKEQAATIVSYWVPDKVVGTYVKATMYEYAVWSTGITIAHTLRGRWDWDLQWRVGSLLCLKLTLRHLLMGCCGRRGAHTIQTALPSLPLLF